MPKVKMGILEEVVKLNQQYKKLVKENPQDPSLAALKAEIEKKMETDAYKDALEAEEIRMGEELKKLFNA
jgi:hypothetical protein